MAGLDPVERSAFRIGALAALERSIKELSTHDNLAKFQIGTRVPRIMELLSPSPEAYRQFSELVGDMWSKTRKTRKVFGNSDTTFNDQLVRDIEGGAWGGAISQILSGDVGGAVRSTFANRAADWLRYGLNQRRRDLLSRMMFTSQDSMAAAQPHSTGIPTQMRLAPVTPEDMARWTNLIETAPQRVANSIDASVGRAAFAARLPIAGLNAKTSGDRQYLREKTVPDPTRPRRITITGDDVGRALGR
jgi:hypothetical protein